MSGIKAFAEEISDDMGHGGEITDEVVQQAQRVLAGLEAFNHQHGPNNDIAREISELILANRLLAAIKLVRDKLCSDFDIAKDYVVSCAERLGVRVPDIVRGI